MKKYFFPSLTALLLLMLSACTPDISSGSYSTNNIGAAQNAYNGVIVSATPVKVSGDNQQAGQLVGLAGGAIAGSAIGGGSRANLLGGLAGGVAGALLGGAAGNRIGNQTGMRYIVRLDSGRQLSVVQGIPPVLAVHQKVTVLTGGGTRPRVVAR